MNDRISTRISGALIEYLEKEGADMNRFFESVDISRDQLCDPARRLSEEDLIILFAQARDLMQDPLVPYWTGRRLAKASMSDGARQKFYMEKNLDAAFERLAEWSETIYPFCGIEIEITPSRKIITNISKKEHCLYTNDHCLFFRGLIEGIISLYGYSTEKLIEKKCMVSIDRAGIIHGKIYRISDDGLVTELPAKAAETGEEGNAVGMLDENQSFEKEGTRYGAEKCQYEINISDKRPIIKRFWNATFGQIVSFLRLLSALEQYQIMDGETFQKVTSDWNGWIKWEGNYSLTKAKYLAYFGIIALACLPLMGNFFESISHELFRGFSTLLLSVLILMFGFLVTKLQIDNARKLLRQKEQSEQFLQRAGVGITMVNKDYEIVYANPLVHSLHGDVAGKKCYEVLCWEVAPCPGCKLEKVFEEKIQCQEEIRYFTSDGCEIWFYVNSTPLFDKRGEVKGMLNISTDITEKKFLELELENKTVQLQASEEKYRNFMENAADAIVITDLEGNLVDASNQLYKMLEMDEKKPEQGTKIFETMISDPQEIQKLIIVSKDMINEKKAGEFELKLDNRHDGKIDVEVRAIPIIYKDRVEYMQYIMRDITERKRREFEKNLMLSISRAIKDAPNLDELVEHAVNGISAIMEVPIAAIFIKEQDKQQLNLAAQVGLSAEAIKQLTKIVVDGSATSLASRTAILNRPLVISDVAQLKMTPQTKTRLEDMGVVSMICMPMLMEDKLQGVIQIASRDKNYFSKERQAILSQVANELAVGIARQGLTDALEKTNKELIKKHKELENATLQLLHSEKMASIGQLAAGVAHEINNPMGFITSNLNILDDYRRDLKDVFKEHAALIKELRDNKNRDAIVSRIEQIAKVEDKVEMHRLFEEFEDVLKESMEGAERVKNIVLNLREFSHPVKGEPEFADINEGIESTLNIVWNELKYKARVIKNYGELPKIKCFPQELNQVFMNILVNAVQAIDKKGDIEIKTWAKNGKVFAMIKDTGCGMTKETLGKIYDPFFTTKEVGKGTGLGLSITYRIVKKHGGGIKVESEPGVGTEFTVELPVKGIENDDAKSSI